MSTGLLSQPIDSVVLSLKWELRCTVLFEVHIRFLRTTEGTAGGTVEMP